MKCLKCETENPETSRFCADCGTQLGTTEDIPVGPTVTLETPIPAIQNLKIPKNGLLH
jgi:hypothetical protein